MATVGDVAAFAQQLKQDGIDAARAEADKIVADARQQAAAIVSEAKQQAQKLVSEAETQGKRYRERCDADLQLAARDLVLMVKARLEKVLTALLAKEAARALESRPVLEEAILAMVRAGGKGEWQVSLGEKTAAAFGPDGVQKLLSGGDAKLLVKGHLREAGFELRPPDGSEIHELTESSVAEQFRRLLAPALGKLVTEAIAGGAKKA